MRCKGLVVLTFLTASSGCISANDYFTVTDITTWSEAQKDALGFRRLAQTPDVPGVLNGESHYRSRNLMYYMGNRGLGETMPFILNTSSVTFFPALGTFTWSRPPDKDSDYYGTVRTSSISDVNGAGFGVGTSTFSSWGSYVQECPFAAVLFDFKSQTTTILPYVYQRATGSIINDNGTIIGWETSAPYGSTGTSRLFLTSVNGAYEPLLNTTSDDQAAGLTNSDVCFVNRNSTTDRNVYMLQDDRTLLRLPRLPGFKGFSGGHPTEDGYLYGTAYPNQYPEVPVFWKRDPISHEWQIVDLRERIIGISPHMRRMLERNEAGQILAEYGEKNYAADSYFLLTPAFPKSDIEITVQLDGFTGGAVDHTIYPVTWKLTSANGSYLDSGESNADQNHKVHITTANAGVNCHLIVKRGQGLAKRINGVVLSNSVFSAETRLSIGDLDNDNKVDVVDFDLLVASFGTEMGAAGYNAWSDLDGDGEIGLFDYLILSGSFGKTGDS